MKNYRSLITNKSQDASAEETNLKETNVEKTNLNGINGIDGLMIGRRT